jgi:hypothetical protein
MNTDNTMKQGDRVTVNDRPMTPCLPPPPPESRVMLCIPKAPRVPCTDFEGLYQAISQASAVVDDERPTVRPGKDT